MAVHRAKNRALLVLPKFRVEMRHLEGLRVPQKTRGLPRVLPCICLFLKLLLVHTNPTAPKLLRKVVEGLGIREQYQCFLVVVLNIDAYFLDQIHQTVVELTHVPHLCGRREDLDAVLVVDIAHKEVRLADCVQKSDHAVVTCPAGDQCAVLACEAVDVVDV